MIRASNTSTSALACSGSPCHCPAARPGLAGEQRKLAGRRYPQDAHGFTSPEVVGAIRDEVNLFAS